MKMPVDKTMNNDQRVIMKESMLTEDILKVYELSAYVKLKKRLKCWLIVQLKKVKVKLHRWLHKHERFYEFLISLGAKDLYFKIKRRIIS